MSVAGSSVHRESPASPRRTRNEGGGGGRGGEERVHESLLPPFAKHLSGAIKGYVPEGDVEFPFEDITGAGDENRIRGNWASGTDSLMAIAAFTLGLGNLWRFPFLVHKYGGVAFFIPFTCCLALAAIPMFFLECALGQFSSLSAVSVWKVVPLFKGLGLSMLLISCAMSVYLNVIAAWSLFYLFNSVGFTLPWSTCDNSWSGINCTSLARSWCLDQNGSLLLNGSCIFSPTLDSSPLAHSSRLPSLEYFHRDVLMLSSSIDEVAPLNWYLGICLVIGVLATFLCLFQSVKSSGKIAYILVVVPQIIMVVLLARLLTVGGSLSGVLYLLRPRLAELARPVVWGEAAVHAFYSLSCCTGGLATLSSYNRFHSNLFQKVWWIGVADILFSFAACCLVFSAIGFISHQFGVPIDKFQLKDGAHLLFVVLAEALSELPVAPLYSTLYFLMLFILLLSTQIFVVETVVSSICDLFAEKLRRHRRHVLAVSCVFLVLLSLPFCSSAGMYWLAVLDRFVLSWPLIMIAFLEVMGIGWIYGVDNLLDNIKWMTGQYPPVYLFWKLLWKFICPLVFLVLLSFVWLEWVELSYEAYSFPYWTSILGWTISSLPILLLLISAVFQLVYSRGSIIERWWKVLNPDDAWGPALAVHRAEHFPLQIPEARRLLLPSEEDRSGVEWKGEKWKESREESLYPSGPVSTERFSQAATAASGRAFEKETAI